MKRTNPIRNNTETSTICKVIVRYAKLFLHMSGIDVTVFTAHPIRSSSASKVESMGLSLKDIEKAAGWSHGSTF